MNVYKRGGDSLMGRYHHYTLFPLTLSEFHGRTVVPGFSKSPPAVVFGKPLDLEPLFHFGGFPEPLLSGSERVHKRWARDRFELIFREDIRDLEDLRLFSKLELLGLLIPKRIGSPLSLQSLAEDLEVAHRSVQHWLEIMEKVYYLFTISPWTGKLSRLLKKERKVYLWDWSGLEDSGSRFENLIAVHLLKWCLFHQEAHGIDVRLWYIRDREKREVDFLVSWEGEPLFLAECKLSDERPAHSLDYFGDRLEVKKRFHVTYQGTADYQTPSGTHVLPAAKFLTAFL